MADDRGVGEQEQRLGDQGQEGRDGEAQDLAVVGRGGYAGAIRVAGRIPRREPRRYRNLCKTRALLWVTSAAGGFVDKRTRLPRCRNGEQESARNLLSTA